MNEPTLTWELSSGYELLVSLMVLNDPDYFGQRPAWAAGVRARLPTAAREALARGKGVLKGTLTWAANQPERADAASLIGALAELPAELRLAAFCSADRAETYAELAAIARGPQPGQAMRAWAEVNWAGLFAPADARALLEQWTDPAGFGERYLSALRAYYELFFADEELRVAPAMAQALEQARALGTQLARPALLEQLTRGLDMSTIISGVKHLRLAPSYWATPIMVAIEPAPGELLVLFSARPLGASLAAGEAVPASLVDALKALADPTRLAIMRELAREPLLPTQLGLRLRLRPATISHHLKLLRLAGLVRIRLEEGTARHYAARPEGLAATFAALEAFIKGETG